jgi:streptogramin lyase
VDRGTRGDVRRPGLAPAALVAMLLILLGVSAIPMLAFGDEPTEPAVATAPVEGTPSAEAMTSALVAKEAELAAAESRLEEELATPAAEGEREASQDAYAEVDASEAYGLLKEQFAPAIEELNEDPARLLSAPGVEVEKVLSPTAARISTPAGGREIVEGTVPLTSSLGGEGKEPVDLALGEEGGDFVPANPLTPTTLPAGAEGSIGLGEEVRVELPAADDHEAVEVGQTMLFYPETEASTDTLVAPVSGGVEILDQLRSAESPEELRFHIDLPSGAALKATEGGGAEVVDGEGEVLKEVPAPTTTDAQGASVPTTMSVEGDDLVVSVSLAGSEVAYPALVDPEFLSETAPFSEPNWLPYEYLNGGSVAYPLGIEPAHLLGRSSGSNALYEPESHGQYVYETPGPTAWISGASFSAISFYPVCGGSQPHGYIGLYNTATGTYEKLEKWEREAAGVSWQTLGAASANTHWAVFGIGTGAAVSQLSCVHEFWLGGYSLQEKDVTPPVVTSVTGVPLGHWFKPSEAGPVHLTAEDTGFGVAEVTLGNEGGVTNSVFPNNCTGTENSRCPHVFEWEVPAPYVPGKHEFKVTARDPMGNKTPTGSIGETWLDNKNPEIVLNGQFAEATEEVGRDKAEIGGESHAAEHHAEGNKLSIPTYELEIHAIDGSNAERLTMQSGVSSVKVFLDGAEQSLPWGSQASILEKCPQTESSCAAQGTYTLKLPGLTAGVHVLRILAKDRVGHEDERKIEFEYLPATGEGGTQVLEHFPLPDQGGTPSAGEEEAQPEISVDVMNGNLVFHQQDAEISTSDAGLPIERFYNSELPSGESGEFGKGWTLGDTPELEIGAGGSGPGKTTVLEGDGEMETAVPLPAEAGKETFDPATEDSIEKTSSGYTVSDEGAEPEPTADLTGSGTTTDLRGSAGAALDYEHEGGELSEIVVNDPGSASGKAEQAVTEDTRGFLPSGETPMGSAEAGVLRRPTATATDAAGDVYVLDGGHSKIEEFGPGGAPLREWGGAGTDIGTGAFTTPVAIAVNKETGNVYVAEPTRIQEFTSTGGFIRQIGSAGTGEGHFTGLRAITVAPGGKLWALDEPTPGGAYRVQILNDEGTVSKSASIARGSTARATILEPGAIAVDPSEDLWVADTGNSRVQELKLSENGNYGPTLVRTVGGPGAGNGQFSTPLGIALDPSGDVWVTDTGNDRVEEFNSTGTYLRQAGSAGDGNAQFSYPRGIAADPSGDVWVADSYDDRVEKLTPAGAYSAQAGGRASEGGRLSAPVATATDSAGDVYVADAGHYRVQEFSSAGALVRQWGGYGSGSGQFTNIVGIAVSSATGNVYVAEPTRIQVFESNGTFLRQMGAGGVGTVTFTGLRAIAIEPGHELWALDEPTQGGAYRVQVMNGEGTVSKSATITRGTAAETLLEPGAIAVDSSEDLWVADTGNSRVEELRLELHGNKYTPTIVRTVGGLGTATGYFTGPTGIAIDASGHVWVSDTGDDRIEEFEPTGAYMSQAGTAGDGNGQFSGPRGISTDPSGDVWVADTHNDRVERMAPGGAYLAQAGGAVSAAGNLSAPVAAATDSAGDAYVADAGHDRVQEFNRLGTFVRQWGGYGSYAGQFKSMVGIAVNRTSGNVYVAEPTRIEQFTSTGTFVRQIGSAGTQEGQFTGLRSVTVAPDGTLYALDEPTPTGVYWIQQFSAEGAFMAYWRIPRSTVLEPGGIAVDSAHHVWVTDTGNSKLLELFLSPGNLTAGLERSVGGPGTGVGMFAAPRGIALDSSGRVWVADTGNDRVEEFSPEGRFMAKFGRVGDELGQLSDPTDMAVDAAGEVAVTDTANDREQTWTPSAAQPSVPVAPAPAAEVDTTGGLVTAIEGATTGTITYQHSGTSLTAAVAPESTTHYSYESGGRLAKVELPHGTKAEVAYDSVGRVEKVTVTVEGHTPETTKFEYRQLANGQRETNVTRPGKPITHYLIGVKGEVLRWNNTAAPPVINEPTGSLWAQRYEVWPKAVTENDQDLEVSAQSPEGIESIEVVANGSEIVAEQRCPKEHASECMSLELPPWVTETEDWAPGMLQLEILVTEANGEGTSSKRFTDLIPRTTSAASSEMAAPTFARIKFFREARGLDLDLKGNVRAEDERIFNLIDAWHEPGTPEGQVAQSSSESWGVPLRAADVAELDYRLEYVARDAPLIQEWAKAHDWAIYGGYWVDERAGGVIRIGFTERQAELVTQMKQELGGQLLAPERITTFSTAPTTTVAQLEASAASIHSYAATHPALQEDMATAEFEPATNKVAVEVVNVAQAESEVAAAIGSLAHVQFVHVAETPQLTGGRYRASGPIKAGDFILNLNPPHLSCTAAFGADERRPPGQPTMKYLLTAGHCFEVGVHPTRANSKNAYRNEWYGIGEVVANAYPETHSADERDVEAIELRTESLAPTEIYPHRTIRPAAGPSGWEVNQQLCFSGATDEVQCGPSAGVTPYAPAAEADITFAGKPYLGSEVDVIQLNEVEVNHGDSGSPVWNRNTGEAVGILSAGAPLGVEDGTAFITPLEPIPGTTQKGALTTLTNRLQRKAPLTLNPYGE